MFLVNKYSRWYNSLIEKAKCRNLVGVYFENHHIIPRSLGGSNDATNLVQLTAREHYLCHKLLTKMVTGKNQYRMISAAFMMVLQSKNHKRITVSSRVYEELRIAHSVAISKLLTGFKRPTRTAAHRENHAKTLRGRTPSPETLALLAKHRTDPENKEKRRASMTGQKRSPEAIRNLSAGQKGRDPNSYHVWTDEEKQALSDKTKGKPKSFKGRVAPNKGVAHSEEAIQKMKNSHTNRESITCSHCGKTVPKPNFSRWHGDNCKAKP